MDREKYSLKFSHDKYFKAVSFDEFRKTATDLDEIVRGNRGGVETIIVTCEDPTTCNYSTTPFWSEEIEEALSHRKEYSLDKFTPEVWDRSYDVQLTIRLPNDKEPFMVCASVDKTADNKRLKFYGQALDKQTHGEIMERYHNRSMSYRLGDGMGKISGFNMTMGQRLTGIKLPTRRGLC